MVREPEHRYLGGGFDSYQKLCNLLSSSFTRCQATIILHDIEFLHSICQRGFQFADFLNQVIIVWLSYVSYLIRKQWFTWLQANFILYFGGRQSSMNKRNGWIFDYVSISLWYWCQKKEKTVVSRSVSLSSSLCPQLNDWLWSNTQCTFQLIKYNWWCIFFLLVTKRLFKFLWILSVPVLFTMGHSVWFCWASSCRYIGPKSQENRSNWLKNRPLM